jgi:hypothetical protein
MLRRDYDIMEKRPDGSLLRRQRVTSKHAVRRKLHELAEKSESEFIVIDVQTGEPLFMAVAGGREMSGV